MPRNSGRSGLTTTWPILRSPSDRSELRCALVPPIFDLTCVTFSCAICLLLRPRRAYAPAPAAAARARSMAAGATSSIGRPRLAAISSGRFRLFRATTVACTTLIGLDEPSERDSTSWMPAHSSTARTGPPAMTPVPGLAGFSSTTPAAASPCTVCGIVPAIRGTRKKCFLASSTPLAMAAGTSLALPYPTPTSPFPSPTTTSAVKLKRRPPWTTLATRLMATIFSRYAVPRSAAPLRRSSRRSRRSPPPPEPRRAGGIRCSPSCCSWWRSQLQPAFPRTVRERGHAAVVGVAATVEHHRADAGRLRTLREQRAHLLCLGGLVAVRAADRRFQRGSRDQGAPTESSTSCANRCRDERVTTSRGLTAL